MAHIRTRKNGKHTVLYRDPTTGKERSAGTFTRKSDALKQRRAVEYKLQAGDWIDPTLQATPYGDWAQTWIGTKSHLKPKTLEGYESLFNSRILPRFGDARLRDIRTIDIEQWLSTMNNAGLSTSRVRQAHSLLSSTLKAAVRSRMLSSNPAVGVSLPEASTREMLFLNPEQVRRLAEAIPEAHRTMVYTLAYTGIRRGEATALRRRSVNFLRRELTVTESASVVRGRTVFGETKNRETRTIAIPAFLAEMLSTHIEYVPPESDALLFTGSTGGPMSWANFSGRVWKPAVISAQLDPGLRIHDMRHTAASMLIAQGCHPKVVQEHLGHSSITITMDRYGHLYPEDRSKVADALDTAFAAGGKEVA